jgi:hypothetical protein
VREPTCLSLLSLSSLSLLLLLSVDAHTSTRITISSPLLPPSLSLSKTLLCSLGGCKVSVDTLTARPIIDKEREREAMQQCYS